MKRWPIALAAMVGGIVFAGHAAGLRINHTSSLPYGVWQDDNSSRAMKAGDVVVACPRLPPDLQVYIERGNCPDGREPVLKKVAAIAGDTVEMTFTGISVNGRMIPESAPLVTDSQGRTLKAYPVGAYKVPAGEVWLVNPMKLSLDSRYTGPVLVSDIVSVTVPRIVW